MQFSCICLWIPVGNQLGISWDVNFVYFIWKSVGNLLGCEFSCICFWNHLGVSWNVNFCVFAFGISLEINWDVNFRVFAFGISWDAIFMYLLLDSSWESVRN